MQYCFIIRKHTQNTVTPSFTVSYTLITNKVLFHHQEIYSECIYSIFHNLIKFNNQHSNVSLSGYTQDAVTPYFAISSTLLIIKYKQYAVTPSFKISYSLETNAVIVSLSGNILRMLLNKLVLLSGYTQDAVTPSFTVSCTLITNSVLFHYQEIISLNILRVKVLKLSQL